MKTFNELGNIFILTGAGISKESGLDTFRDQDGLWANHRIDDVATPEGFKKNPKLVQKFYNQRRNELKKVKPNAAHEALAKLESAWPGKVTLVTQNVDDLHQRAGSKNIIHMHGRLKEVRCVETGKVFQWEDELEVSDKCACCDKKGNLRPNIVWFGELPADLPRIFQALDTCDYFMSIGTSGNVYPAGGFAQHVQMRNSDTQLSEFNIDDSEITHLFQNHYKGPATETVPAFVETMLGKIRL
jgi:NAD-dependent deacetylase